MLHGTHAPPENAGSTAPPPASTTAAGLPARMTSRTVNTDPRDGPNRNATTPDEACASRRERASNAVRPSPAPSTTRPPCALKERRSRLRHAPTGPGRNTAERAHAARPHPSSACSA